MAINRQRIFQFPGPSRISKCQRGPDSISWWLLGRLPHRLVFIHQSMRSACMTWCVSEGNLVQLSAFHCIGLPLSPTLRSGRTLYKNVYPVYCKAKAIPHARHRTTRATARPYSVHVAHLSHIKSSADKLLVMLRKRGRFTYRFFVS